jgi:dTDP-4-amino-4,6-dideoxygalactose transaminase
VINHSKPHTGILEKAAINKLLDTQLLSRGEIAASLEKKICADTGYIDSVSVSSASIGIFTILKYRFPKGGARVALSSYICRSVWDAIKMAGCIPVLFDIKPDSLAIDVDKIADKKIDMAIVAHMFGIKAEFENVLKLGIEVIEDCAQRIAPTYIRSEPKANWRVYSFDPTKLITSGQGGVISGMNLEQMMDIRQLLGGNYDFIGDCVKAPFTDLQASIALVQWNRLNEFLEKRKEIATFYSDTLFSHNLESIIDLSMLKEDTWHFRYIIKMDFPDQFIKAMEKKGIACRKPINPFGLHKLFNIQGDFSQTENATNNLISIPLYPALAEEEKVNVIKSLIDYYA